MKGEGECKQGILPSLFSYLRTVTAFHLLGKVLVLSRESECKYLKFRYNSKCGFIFNFTLFYQLLPLDYHTSLKKNLFSMSILCVSMQVMTSLSEYQIHSIEAFGTDLFAANYNQMTSSEYTWQYCLCCNYHAHYNVKLMDPFFFSGARKNTSHQSVLPSFAAK